MKSVMLEDMRRRFSGMMDEPLYVIATLADPRYRLRLFDADQQTKATSLLSEAVQRQRIANDDVSSPAAKRQRLEHSTADGLDDVLDELLAGPTDTSTPHASTDNVVAVVDEQVRLYLLQANIPRQASATSWWQENAVLFPDVAAVAQRYLSAPATSVPSERLFSSAGLVYSDRRNRLLPERAEQLLFIKHNLNAL